MPQTATMTVGVQVRDVTGQKVVRAPAVPASSTIREMVERIIGRMGLSRNDVQGRPLQYQVRLDREGRHLNGAETVGDALVEGDELTIAPSIDAG